MGPIIGSAPGRQTFARFREAFVHLLAGKVDIHMVTEDGSHLGKAITRNGAGIFQARNTRQGCFDGKGDLFLHLHGRQRRRERVDLHLLVRDVRHRINWQTLQGIHPQARRGQSQEHEEHAVLNGEADKTFEHGPYPFSAWCAWPSHH